MSYWDFLPREIQSEILDFRDAQFEHDLKEWKKQHEKVYMETADCILVVANTSAQGLSPSIVKALMRAHKLAPPNKKWSEVRQELNIKTKRPMTRGDLLLRWIGEFCTYLERTQSPLQIPKMYQTVHGVVYLWKALDAMGYRNDPSRAVEMVLLDQGIRPLFTDVEWNNILSYVDVIYQLTWQLCGQNL
jgi:hypothetical protein